MATSSVEDFLSGPLVTWFTSCLEEQDAVVSYEDLVDGVVLHDVFLQINPEPLHDGVVPSAGSPALRTKNLTVVIGNIRQFYEEELGQVVLVLPDVIKLGKNPEISVGEMKLLLLLLLGCAVQCPNKERFITKIKDMAVDVQLAIVDCIKQVTDDQSIVITQESMENVNMGVLFNQIKRLVHERDSFYEKWKGSSSTENPDNNESAISGVEIDEINKLSQANSIVKSDRGNNHHHAVELADWKSKVRKQRQELEEKTEALLECKEEMEHTKAALAKLRQENQELMHEARTAKSYRDELDAVIERAERADRLEIEVARYKEKLADIEFYKTRLEEIREDNRVLMETREMLEEQLTTTRRRSDKVPELESEIIKYKQLLNDATLEREADKERYQEICEENAQLRCIKKGNLNETAISPSMSDSEEPATADNSLSEQLTNNAQTRALKLELENRRLVTLIDSLQENSFHESSTRVLELEKDKKKLSLKISSLNDNSERLTQQNADLERICRDALEENKKLQDSLNNKRAVFDKQQLENQSQSSKIADLERSHDLAVKEKQRVQSLQESAQRRADDLERSLDLANQKLEELKNVESKLSDTMLKCTELETKLVNLEREKDNAQRDVNKYRLTIEDKDIALDKAANEIEIANNTVQQLKQEVAEYNSQISRLRDIERSSKELDSRAAIDRETLEALQSDLVAEKLNTQHLSTVLEKFGVNINMLLSLPTETIIETISKVPEIIDNVKKFVTIESPPLEQTSEADGSPAPTNNTITEQNRLQDMLEALEIETKKVRAELTASHTTSDNLLEENAKLQVNITTLQSQNTSLTTQHTALQLANSQLVAEKEELLKERASQESIHAQLVNDQIALQILHEGLNNEYEKLLVEREVVKSALRDVKNDARALRETCQSLEAKTKALQAERETLVNNAKSLNNLRGEHSKLKDDFRNLFTATEKLRSEYRNLQEDYKSNKMESNRLSLKQTETNGELVLKDERCSYLEFEMSKLNQRCEMLLQMNSGLDNDRRSLMDHVSLLLSQYHELLTHSLDDKEHYHMEEKLFTDKVNNLCRQKEKLEEKIMEHYRKLESCSTKKKGFGASFVRRVRKAGSELLSKNRRSWADDTKQLDGKPYESESGGNDSDASTDDIRPIKEQQGTNELRSDPLSLGYPGTRRTVYYTDEIPSSTTTMDDQGIPATAQKPDGDERTRSQIDSNTNPEADAQGGIKHPVLIYNKVSAVINESRNISAVEKEVLTDNNETVVERSSEKDPKAGSVWYEYGCV